VARGPLDPERRARSRRGDAVVEPPGYAITQFASSVGFVVGFGLVPDGLLLVAASLILSVIDFRRFNAANPGLLPDTAEGFRTGPGRALYRYSAAGTSILVGLSIIAVALVQRDDLRADALGPGLVGGVVTLALNWRMKRAVEAARREQGIAQRRERGDD
jgi:hypothetical protein